MQLVIEIIELKSRMYRGDLKSLQIKFRLVCIYLHHVEHFGLVSDKVHRNYHRKIESELSFTSDFLTEYECSFCRPSSDKNRSYRYPITPEYIPVLIREFLLTTSSRVRHVPTRSRSRHDRARHSLGNIGTVPR
jgi:hypothetical protein